MAKSDSKNIEEVTRTTSSKIKSTKKPTTKKVETKKNTLEKSAKKATTAKKATKSTTEAKSTKKTTTKKVETEKNSSTTSKKSSTSKRKTTSKKSAKTKKKVEKQSVPNIVEYYDLPSTYNQTTVKLLFQTPKKLFVYWEISEADKQKYFDENGKDFFESTTPFLVVRNITKNYSFEIEINDFANSWYFDVPDSKCDYEVSLIRKHNITHDSTWITTSNELEVPNNRILFEHARKEIFFKNVKTNNVVSKSVVNLQFINHLGNIFNANSFYRKFYQDENLYTLNNPTSNSKI